MEFYEVHDVVVRDEGAGIRSRGSQVEATISVVNEKPRTIIWPSEAEREEIFKEVSRQVFGGGRDQQTSEATSN
jgi:hypothetical protein